MPRFQVITVRSLYNGVIIDAEDEAAAKNFDGAIIAEEESHSWPESTHSVEEVADDCDEVELP